MATQKVLGNKEVVRERAFVALEAIKDSKLLRITYNEKIIVDGEVTKDVNKSYTRDYDTWETSELGQSILAMINADLGFDNPETLS